MNKKFGAFSERKFRGGNSMDTLALLKRKVGILNRAESGDIPAEKLSDDIIGNRFIAVDADGITRMIMSSDSLIELIGVEAYLAALKTDGTVTFYVDADTGALMAGAGAVRLDADGIRIKANTTSGFPVNANSYSFIDAVGNIVSQIGHWISGGWSTLVSSVLDSAGNRSMFSINSISDIEAQIEFTARDDTSGKEAKITLGAAGGIGTIAVNSSGDNIDTVIKGDTTNVFAVDASAEKAIIGILDVDGATTLNALGAAAGDTIIKGDTTDVVTVDASAEKAIITKLDVTGTLDISAAAVVGGWKTVRKAADESRLSNTTLTADSDLGLTAAASKTYAVRGRIWFETPAAADFKFRFAFTGGTSIFIHHVSIPCGSATETVGIETATPTTTISCLGTGTTGGYIEFDGKLVCDGTPRTFITQWAQVTSTASNTTVKAGSYLEYLQVD